MPRPWQERSTIRTCFQGKRHVTGLADRGLGEDPVGGGRHNSYDARAGQALHALVLP